jgi:hypothetical protein
MAISFITNALGGTTTTTSFSITLPATQAGDILILEYVHRGTTDATLGGTSISTGGLTWLGLHDQQFTASGPITASGKTYWTRCTGDHAGQTITGASLNNSCAAIVTQYRGCVASGNPISDATVVVGEDNASGVETQAEITTTTDGAWVVLVVVNSPDLAVASQSCTSPGALTERAEVLSTGGTDTSISHASAEKATAGATGAFTWAQTDANHGSWAYAIKPATGATHSGSGTATLPLATASGAGTKARKGTGTPSLPTVTASGTASRALKGSGAPTLTLITGSGSGKKERAGTGSASLPLQTASGAGKRDLKSTGAPTLTLVTASGSGSVAPPGGATQTGSGSATLPALAASGVGTKERKGTGTPSLPSLTASGAGSRALKGSGTPSLSLLTAEGVGTMPVTHSGEGAANLPLLSASGQSGQAVEEQRSGGYGWANLAAIERRRRKREEEELADALEVAMAAEGLVEPDPVVAARHVVREYVKTSAPATRRMQRAVEHAYRAQSDLAWQLAAREIARQEEDDFAVLLAIATLH